MSTKSTRRSSSVTKSKAQAPSTPNPISTSWLTSSVSDSPVSPATRLSRLQEKSNLVNLNDRLAAYIDKVRELEEANRSLTTKISTVDETYSKEIKTIRQDYEKEMGIMQNSLDRFAKENAELTVNCGKLRSSAENTSEDLKRQKRELELAHEKLSDGEEKIENLKGKVKYLESEKKKLETSNKDLAKEKGQLRELKQQLESEVLARVDLENRLQSKTEEVNFVKQVYEKQIQEFRQQKKVEITEIDGQRQKERGTYGDKLMELREQFEEQLAIKKSETETMYKNRIASLQRQISLGANDAGGISNQLRESRSRMKELKQRIEQLEGNNLALEKKMHAASAQWDRERDIQRAEVESLKDEITRLTNERQVLEEEYNDLLDIKINLDMEIATYRKLIESEEERLNLTPSNGFQSSGSSKKRKRTVLQEKDETDSSFYLKSTSKGTGDIEIVEECVEGNFIKLENTTEKDISLSGYILHRKAGNDEITYKFQRQVKLPAKTVFTVWSSDCVQDQGPNNLVMKNQRWPIDNKMITTLSDKGGAEVISRESFREKHAYSTSTTGSPVKRRNMYEKDNCSIM